MDPDRRPWRADCDKFVEIVVVLFDITFSSINDSQTCILVLC